MSLNQNEQTFLTENNILRPKDGSYYIQNGNDCGNIIFDTNFTPSRLCMFSIQTNSKGLYILNNSNCVYLGNLYLIPNQVHIFNINRQNNSWIITCNSAQNEIVADWSSFFYSNVIGPPPLSSRKYALFINAIYNSLIEYKNLPDEAVINESAKHSCNVLIPSLNTDMIYNKYDKLDNNDKTLVFSFVDTFLTNNTIPNNALSPTYVLPPEQKDKWYGTNPVLPNWNPTNISYLANTFTTIQHDPSSTIENDAKELSELVRTLETNEIAYHFANTPPPAHLNKITCRMLSHLEPLEMTKALAFISICVADAGLFAWNVKYTYWGARPFQYITGFTPVIATPNFPGYISGHSTFSAAWAKSLSLLYPNLKNISKYIAELSGISRLYGGIHFSDDNTTGLNCGTSIASSVYKMLVDKIKNNESLL